MQGPAEEDVLPQKRFSVSRDSRWLAPRQQTERVLKPSSVLQPQENMPWLIQLWDKQGGLCQSPHYGRVLPPNTQGNAKNSPSLHQKNIDFLHIKGSVWLYSVRGIFFFLVSCALWSHKIKMRFDGQLAHWSE